MAATAGDGTDESRLQLLLSTNTPKRAALRGSFVLYFMSQWLEADDVASERSSKLSLI